MYFNLLKCYSKWYFCGDIVNGSHISYQICALSTKKNTTMYALDLTIHELNFGK